jgi:niacin transporter
MSARKVTVGGLFIALSILLPQIFHLAGTPQVGQVLLPMHLPVLLSGFILGPVFGCMVGAASPVLSAMLTGMPMLDRLPFMVVELAGYGLISGLFYQTLQLRGKKFGAIVSLVSAMIFGRLLYALMAFVAADLLNLSALGVAAVAESVVKGISGIFVQLLLIPTMIYILERSGYYDKIAGAGKKYTA